MKTKLKFDHACINNNEFQEIEFNQFTTHSLPTIDGKFYIKFKLDLTIEKSKLSNKWLVINEYGSHFFSFNFNNERNFLEVLEEKLREHLSNQDENDGNSNNHLMI